MPTQGSSSSSRRDGGGKDEEKTKSLTATTNSETASMSLKLQNEVQQHVSQEQKRFIKRYRTEIAASASSVLSTLSTFPLDSVKTRMQTYKYGGFVDCVQHTYRAEQMKGFFRGKSLCPPRFSPESPIWNVLSTAWSFPRTDSLVSFPGVTAPLASITLVRTISFSIYQRSKYVYSNWLKRNFAIDVLAHVNAKGTYPSLSSVACFGAAGATAGSCITLIACKNKTYGFIHLWLNATDTSQARLSSRN